MSGHAPNFTLPAQLKISIYTIEITQTVQSDDGVDY